MANIITTSDRKKFIALLKAGLKHGIRQNLESDSGTDFISGTNAPKMYHIRLHFEFQLEPNHIEALLSEDMTDNEIDDLLSIK